jgi:PST family polysaccharide transporter
MTATTTIPHRYAHWLERKHLEQNLKSKSVSGGIQTIGAQIVAFLMNMASTIFMARLLTPEDYGIIAMVTSVTGFVLIFKDIGLTQAIIQKEHITQDEVSQIFWLNLLIGLLLGAIILLMGPALSHFYKEPRLTNITRVFAFVGILGGLAAQHTALLNRQMQFKKLALITVLSSCISLATGILLAYKGWGYLSIAYMTLIQAVVQTLLYWTLCNWRPNAFKLTKQIKHYINFGAGITGFNTINYFSRNLDNILIGKLIGASALGLYSRAYQLLMLPISQIRDPLNAVGIPALSTLNEQPEKYRNYYKEFLFLFAFFSMPAVVLLFICAEPLILLILGPKWISAAPIFRLLAVTALIQPIASTRGMIMISTGQSKRYFKWGIWNAVVVIFAFLAGIQWGVNGVAIGYALANYIILVPSLQFCFKNTPVSVSDFFKTIAPVTGFSLVSGVATWVLFKELQVQHPFTQILLGLILFGSIYLTSWMLMKQTRMQLYGIWNLIQTIVYKRTK